MDSFPRSFDYISTANFILNKNDRFAHVHDLWKHDHRGARHHPNRRVHPLRAACGKISLGAMAVRRRRAPEPIASTLGSIIDRLDSEGHFAIVRLVQAWPEIVGETISRRTEVVELKFHTAVVRVSGAMWIQELNLLKPEILARLAARVGDDAVRDLRFVQGRLSRRPARPRLRTVARAPRRAIELPELKDPELRRAFESLIEAWGRAPR